MDHQVDFAGGGGNWDERGKASRDLVGRIDGVLLFEGLVTRSAMHFLKSGYERMELWSHREANHIRQIR